MVLSVENLGLEFDVYTRCFFITQLLEKIKKDKKKELTILDVGGRNGHLQDFLSTNDHLTILDILPKELDKRDYIQGSILDAPFEANSFDVVVSSHLYEHIPAKDRAKTIREMIRISKNYIILAGPFANPGIAQAEKAVNKCYKDIMGQPHPWLREHIENGLPDAKEFEKILKEEGCVFSSFSSMFLPVWQQMQCFLTMVGQIEPKLMQQISSFYNQNFTELGETVAPGYQQIYSITKKGKTLAYTPPHSTLNKERYAALMTMLFEALPQEIGKVIVAKDTHITNVTTARDIQTTALEYERDESKKQRKHIGNLEAAVKGEQEALKELHVVVEKQQVHINNLEAAVKGEQEALKELHVVEEKQREHIGNLEAAVKGEQGALKESRIVEEKQREHIKNLTVDIVQKQKTITILEETIQALKEDKQKLETQRAELLTHLENKDTHIRNIEALLNQKENTIQAIYNSRSWRIIHSYATIKKLFLATVWTIRHQGIVAVWRKVTEYMQGKGGKPQVQESDYQKWIKKNTPTDADKTKALKAITQWQKKPLCSVLIAVQDENGGALQDTLYSLKSQWYTEWNATFVLSQNCTQEVKKALHNAVKKEHRMHIVMAEEAETPLLEVARKNTKGEFILPLRNGAMLAPDALYQYARMAQQHKTAIIYTDEDLIDDKKQRVDPCFKPDWSPHLLLSTMYMGHVWYPRHLVNELGGFHKGYAGSEEYDLALRATERLKPAEIMHVPQVLIHTQKNTYSTEATGEKALTTALKRRKIQGAVEKGIAPESFRVHYKITKKPLVSIIIPTRGIPLLRTCLKAIHEKTTGVQYEVIVMNNSRSEDPEKKSFFAELEKDFAHCRVVEYNQPFNFSKINNFGAAQAKGDFVLLLNDDTEPLTAEWLSAMVEQAQQPEVGAVGAKLLYPNNTIQHAGVVLGIGDVAGHSHKYLPNSFDHHGYQGFLNMVRDYSAVTAACLMSRRDVFEELHGLDETLAVAFNDVDYCLRVCKAGYSVVYTPYSLVFHYESISRGKALNQKEVEIMHERWQNVIQHDPFYSPHLSRTHEDFRIRTD